MKQWESQINRLIRESAQRRASERSMSKIANSTNPRQTSTYAPGGQGGYMPGPNFSSRNRGDSVYTQAANSGMYAGPQGYPQHDGFGFDNDEDDYEDYPPSTYNPQSGRGTPLGTRRLNAQSMPPERDAVPGYDRPRAQTEDTNGPVMAQWRNNVPPPSNAAANRPRQGRVQSNTSVSSSGYGSETSNFGTGPRSRPPLRSQFSSTKLKSVYDNDNYRNGPTVGLPPAPSNALPMAPPPMNRSRSASQPQAYVPKSIPPPLPATNQWNPRSNTSMGVNKRESGSSQSTGDSSDYSPNSSSPITPFDSSESSLGGVGMRAPNGAGNTHSPYPPVKVKVHFNEDIFVIQVPRMTEYDELVEKVGRKIRLCGPRRDDGPLRVKYKDEDGDMVSLGSTEDVQMAFEQYRPGGQVTLYVT